MSRNTWIIFVAICILLLGGLWLVSRGNRTDVSDVNLAAIQPASEQSGDIADHVIGNASSKVVIIEYGDYQCPGCRQAAPVLQAIANKYKEDIAFVYRHFPLSSIHPNARAAAGVAEAAGKQGKFWEMHDLLFAAQNEWKDRSGADRTSVFEGYAQSLRLNLAEFLEDLESANVTAKINFDAALGKRAGVSGTPTIFINGELIDQYHKDGQLVPSSTQDAQALWADQEAFENLILLPKLREAGIEISE